MKTSPIELRHLEPKKVVEIAKLYGVKVRRFAIRDTRHFISARYYVEEVEIVVISRDLEEGE